jgi:1,4-dihydroxy-2-naphthoyl-CoA synthase
MQSTKIISRIQSKWVTKKVKTTVPPGQQAAMQASYLLGKSIRQIARETKRDPATVSKIVKSSEMDRIVLDMKQKFFGKLLPRALKSIQFALDEETDGRLGYQVMKDSGVIPSQKEKPEEQNLERIGTPMHRKSNKQRSTKLANTQRT